MKFGAVTVLEDILGACPQRADYIEVPIYHLSVASEKERNEILRMATEGEISVRSLCCLFGADMPLVGEQLDLSRVREYCRDVFALSAQMGATLCVFGSGRARSVPEGYSRERAMEDLVEVGRVVADCAAEYGITIAMEPLSFCETNVMNMVAEAADYARAVNRKNLGILVDFYHFDSNGDTEEGLRQNADLLVHAHIAAPKTRSLPQSEGDYAFFRHAIELLREIGYDGTLSFEGGRQDPGALDELFDLMRSC